jgi:hypothetical protein
MSEDDVFDRLRRVPFRPLFIDILDPIVLGCDIVPEARKERIEAAGWDYDEFVTVFYSEMSAGHITGSATRLADPEWRKSFLSLPAIF